MKDECNGKPIDEFVGLRSKMYSIKRGDKNNMKKAKGVKKCVVKNKLMHEQYKDTLFGAKELWHGMGIIKSEGHELFTMYINKKSLSSFDSKRNIDEDGFNTKAYGHYMLGLDLTEEQAERIMKMDCWLKN